MARAARIAAARASRVWLIVALILAPAHPALAGRKDAKRAVKGDPAALSLYEGMLEAMRRARTLSLESEYVWESGGEEIGRSTYEMRLKKPNYARIDSRSGDGARSGVIVLDGREMWMYWPTGRPFIPGSDSIAATRNGMNSYMRKNGAAGSHSIGREANNLGTGMSMPILDPSIFHGLADPLDAYLNELRSIGTANVEGELCDIVVAEYEERRRTRVLWIARRDRLPRRLEETARLSREIVKREYWRGVSLNAAIPNEVFSWKPPEGWIEYRLPTLVDGLLPPGSSAPDFEVTLLDGTPFRLSHMRGKVVWLCFWRLACPPCRVELPHLDKLHEEGKKKGRNDLVILGFNFADERSLALAYLEERGIDFPIAVDTSAAAQHLYHRVYQTVKGQSAVPLNYIIDREGRIADGWYGYDKRSKAGLKILERLGAAK